GGRAAWAWGSAWEAAEPLRLRTPRRSTRPTDRTRERGASWRGGPRAAVAVLEPDDVVELGRGDLDEIGRDLRAHAVARSGLDPEGLARLQAKPRERPVLPDLQQDLTRTDVERPVFGLGVREGEERARLEMEDLSGVALVFREDQPVPPGLRNPPHVRARKILSTSLWSAASCALSASARH